MPEQINQEFRTVSDSLGQICVPKAVRYGAQTARAADNFRISGWSLSRPFLRALCLIKKHAAESNAALGELDEARAKAIAQAAEEAARGDFDDDFIVDVFQTGSGTSTNMNANEVIAHRARELGDGREIHPNDHVNRGQSSNDVIPTALHVATLGELKARLIPALEDLHLDLLRKADEFAEIVKVGRTHLQDATPITLGQEFGGYASQVDQDVIRLRGLFRDLAGLALGGTAVGTGVNTHPEFAARTIRALAAATGLPLCEAQNHFAAQATRDGCVQAGATVRTAAVSLFKIANDIRMLGSGPRCGLGELELPALQPGSSIMPGKVNPVICESVMQVTAQVIGHDAAIAFAGTQGNFELNTMMPVIAHNLLSSIELLSNAAKSFALNCVRGIEADEERCAELAEQSISLATALAPEIGYDDAAKIAQAAQASGKSVMEVARDQTDLDDRQLQQLLEPAGQTGS